MATTMIATTKNANLAHAVLDTKNAETSITNTAIIAVLKAIFPAKTWASLTKLVCMSDSTAKNRMLQRREFTADEIGALLWSEHGREVLIAIMTQAPVEPDWWRVAKSLFQIHDAEKFQHEALVDFYRSQLGMLADTPLGQSALERV